MNPTQEVLFEIAQPAKPNPPVEVLTPVSHPTAKASATRSAEYPLNPDHHRALETALETYEGDLRRLALSASYYRYRGLTHTARIRRDKLFVRISHHFATEEPRVIEAVGHVLFRKLLRRRPLKREWEIAREAEIRLEPIVAGVAGEAPPRRGISTRHWAPPQGKVHDLEQMAQGLSERFFLGRFPEIPLSWTARNVKGYWGKYFAEPPRIVLNRRLDHSKVPDYVVEAVLYHEMLHHHLGIERKDGRRRIHTKEFRAEERKFPKIAEAEKFLHEFGTWKARTRRRLFQWLR